MRRGYKWIWKGPNENNETDFIIAEKLVTIINDVNICGNYRMLACRIKFDFEIEKNEIKINIITERISLNYRQRSSRNPRFCGITKMTENMDRKL